MQKRHMYAAIALVTCVALLFWLNADTDKGTLNDRVGILPNLSHAKWVKSVPKLAAEIDRLPMSADKGQLIRMLADRTTQRQVDATIMQSIANTAEGVVDAQRDTNMSADL